ncbi:MAG: hypothetical protein M3Y35_13990 [Actinomycetota bacterium]|nr:hypothetical protein [Actinomycetota bacterium]
MREGLFGAIAGLLGLVALLIFAATELRTASISGRARGDWLIVVIVVAVIAIVLRIVQLTSHGGAL